MEEVWRPRRINGKADWTTGNGRNRVMLDSDVSFSLLLFGTTLHRHIMCSYDVHFNSLEVFN